MTSVGYSIEYYDARNNKYQVSVVSVCFEFLLKNGCPLFLLRLLATNPLYLNVTWRFKTRGVPRITHKISIPVAKRYCAAKLINARRDATTIYSLFIAADCSTCFWWWHHPSSGAHITVFTASGTGRSVWAATSCYRGWIDTLPSLFPTTIAGGTAQTLRLVPDTVNTVICTPDDGWFHHPKHVGQFAAINKLYILASRWTIINIDLLRTDLWT